MTLQRGDPGQIPDDNQLCRRTLHHTLNNLALKHGFNKLSTCQLQVFD